MHSFLFIRLCTVGFNPFFLSSKAMGCRAEGQKGIPDGRRPTDGVVTSTDAAALIRVCEYPLLLLLFCCCFAVIVAVGDDGDDIAYDVKEKYYWSSMD